MNRYFSCTTINSEGNHFKQINTIETACKYTYKPLLVTYLHKFLFIMIKKKRKKERNFVTN